MRLSVSKNSDVNYLSKIVYIDKFRPHSNPEVNKLKCCSVDGYNIITGIDSSTGLYVYFPTMSQINPEFLAYANLYRNKDLNADANKSGMFDENGRVKTIKLKGELSEGFIIDYEIFNSWLISTTNISLINNDEDLKNIENFEFNQVEHNGKEFWVSRKYRVKKSRTPKEPGKGRQRKVKTGFDRVISEQFRFHYDTIIIKKCPYVISPDSLISITEKIHGTSGISANVICLRKPSLWEKFTHLLIKNNEYLEYANLYASRSVIKNKYLNKDNPGFYGVDVWKYANDIVAPHLKAGMTAYYEIIGFLPNGGYIQKDYDYGCVPPKEGDVYTSEKHFKVRIYRLTYTNMKGDVHEFSAREVQQWCINEELHAVNQLYYGYVGDLYTENDNDTFDSVKFIDWLADNKNFYMEQNSPSCNNKVPHEGLVIKIEDGRSRAFKLNALLFLIRSRKS